MDLGGKIFTQSILGKRLAHALFCALADRHSHVKKRMRSWGVAGACVLYIFPLALNAGWMGLATCLGIMQVGVAGVARASVCVCACMRVRSAL
eukprot:1155077-Pelagomonas_calceolata.AAC.3